MARRAPPNKGLLPTRECVHDHVEPVVGHGPEAQADELDPGGPGIGLLEPRGQVERVPGDVVARLADEALGVGADPLHQVGEELQRLFLRLRILAR